VLTNIHDTPAEGNFYDKSRNTLKPAIVEDYIRHMGYVDKSDRTVNSHYYSPYVEMDEELLFHLFDLKILNSHILLKSCGSTVSHGDFTD
jgi:hypothetical protein